MRHGSERILKLTSSRCGNPLLPLQPQPAILQSPAQPVWATATNSTSPASVCGLLPGNRTGLDARFPVRFDLRRSLTDEDKTVHGAADCLCPAAGGGWNVGCGDLPQKGVSEPTWYRWKKRYGQLLPSEVRKLRQLEEENVRLRRLVSDLSLDKEMLQEVIRKNL